MPESRQPRGAAVTPATGLQQLWAEVRPHAIDPGAVGDFVALQVRVGRAEAERMLPEVAAHGVDECPACSEVARDVRELLANATAPAERPSDAAQPGTEAPHRRPTEPAPASGTVATVLATDIWGAAALRNQVPDALAVVQAQHDQIVRSVTAQHHGLLVTRSGEAILALFDRPRDGLDAAIELQAAVRRSPLGHRRGPRVRIVVHTGRVVWREGRPVGPTVMGATRVLDETNGEQIIVSEAAVAGAHADGPLPYSVQGRGTRSILGSKEPLRLFAVARQDLASEVSLPEASAVVASPALGRLTRAETAAFHLSTEAEPVREQAAAGTLQVASAEAPVIVGNASLFAGLSEDERERLVRLMRARRYLRGEVIFKEGDEGTGLGLIAEGRVRMQLTGSDGREVVINVYGPGEVFGELALLDGEPRSADAIAEDATRVLWLQREDFAAFMDSHPRAAMTIVASLRRRLRHTTRAVRDTTFRDVPAELARVLLDLAARNGRAVEQGVRIEAWLTYGQLAAMVGAPRETVVRALRGFEQRGWIGWRSNRITILQPIKLKARAGDA